VQFFRAVIVLVDFPADQRLEAFRDGDITLGDSLQVKIACAMNARKGVATRLSRAKEATAKMTRTSSTNLAHVRDRRDPGPAR